MKDSIRKHLKQQADSWLSSAEFHKREIEEHWRHLDEALVRRENALRVAAEFRAAAEEG